MTTSRIKKLFTDKQVQRTVKLNQDKGLTTDEDTHLIPWLVCDTAKQQILFFLRHTQRIL